MLFRELTIFLCACSIGTGLLATSGPDHEPFRNNGSVGRQAPELTVKTFTEKGKSCEQASLVVGNKRVNIREENGKLTTRRDNTAVISVYIDNVNTMKITIPGSYKLNGKTILGYPFKTAPGTSPEFIINQAARTVTYRKQYLLPDGSPTTFSYQLKGLDGSKVELDWTLGMSQQQLDSMPKDFSSTLWFNIFNHRNGRIMLNGKEVTLPATKALMEKVRRKDKFGTFYAPVKVKYADFSEITVNPDDAANKVTITFAEKSFGNLNESLTVIHDKNIYNLMLGANTKKRFASRSLIIDLGECILPKKKSQPLLTGGIDFCRLDRLHVPSMPTRNLMPNPSFEQGLRYWSWMYGGGTYTTGEDGKRFVIDNSDAKFGKKSLLIRSSQSPAAISFPIPLKSGKTYTVSCYAKGVNGGETLVFCPISISRPFQFSWRESGKSTSRFKLTDKWQRYSFTFHQQASANSLMLNASGGNLKVDAIQIEESSKESPFISAPAEGFLTTSDPDNNNEYGQPLNAAFHIFGKKGLAGKVSFKLFNFFRETLFEKEYDFSANTTIKLPLDSDKLGTGIFMLRVEYKPKGQKSYYDFYRFSIMKFLKNQHATKTLFGNQAAGSIGRISRSEDLARNLMHWGFGSHSWGNPGLKEQNRLLNKYNFDIAYFYPFNRSRVKGVSGDDLKFIRRIERADKITPVDEKRLEELAFRVVKNYPKIPVWVFFGESECRSPLIQAGNFDEWAKVLTATSRGAKRANPDAKLLPDSGTSGFNPLRGRKELEGYLKSTNGKVKWDIIAVHPYRNLDGTGGTYDLDKETQYLIKLMKKYGYGRETPIMYTESFNMTPLNVPQWNTTNNDNYRGSKPGYDLSNQEYLQTCLAARSYIICLKYWPWVKQRQLWSSTTIQDLRLTPLPLVKAVNTLGHLLPNPVFVTDVFPANGVRAYIFKEGSKTVAALWCTMDKVEQGYTKGPVLRLKTTGTAPKLIDLMGNSRPMTVKNGIANIQLTPAPLFLTGKDTKTMVGMLKRAKILGADANISLRFKPTPDGAVNIALNNLSGIPQRGCVKSAGKSIDFEVAGKQTVDKQFVGPSGNDCGKMYSFNCNYSILMKDCPPLAKKWHMNYFYTMQSKGTPDWSKIPAIAINNYYKIKGLDQSQNFKAEFQVAYDSQNLYLRVTGRKPNLKLNPVHFTRGDYAQRLYELDSALELYIDCGADGLSNTTRGYDGDDYRYDFSMGNPEGKSGPGLVHRLVGVDPQLAGGTNYPSPQEAAKKIKCRYTRTTDGFVYDITIAQR